MVAKDGKLQSHLEEATCVLLWSAESAKNCQYSASFITHYLRIKNINLCYVALALLFGGWTIRVLSSAWELLRQCVTSRHNTMITRRVGGRNQAIINYPCNRYQAVLICLDLRLVLVINQEMAMKWPLPTLPTIQPRKYYPRNVHEYFVPRKLPAIRYLIRIVLEMYSTK